MRRLVATATLLDYRTEAAARKALSVHGQMPYRGVWVHPVDGEPLVHVFTHLDEAQLTEAGWRPPAWTTQAAPIPGRRPEDTVKPDVECTCPRGYLTNRCAAHTYGPDEDAPSALTSSPQGDENGSGVGRVGLDDLSGSQTRYASCGLPLTDCPGDHGDHDDYPPLQETYPGSGIYE